MGETLGQWAKKQSVRYEVVRQVKGGQRTMRTFWDYEKAAKHFRKHPRAFGIQKYAGKSGITAGLIQPTIPKQIKVGGKPYRAVYVGFHTKKTAHALAKGMDKSVGKIVVRKVGKKGYLVYAPLS